MAAPMLLNIARGISRQQTLLTKTSPVALVISREKSVKTGAKKLPKVGVNKALWVSKQKKGEILSEKKQKEKVYLGTIPEEDVWLHAHYPPQCFSLQQCIQRHRELAQPAMLNNMDGVVYFEAALNLTGSKKELRSKRFKSIRALLPHEFEMRVKKKIAVIVMEEDDKELARQLGADIVGGLELAKEIESGTLLSEDFDVLITNNDTANNILKLRAILVDKFPTRNALTVGPEIKPLIEFHKKCVEGHLVRDGEFSGRIQVPIGTLEMEDNDLLENYEKFMPHLLLKKSKQVDKFVTEMVVLSPPSDEKFHVDLEEDGALSPEQGK